MTNITLRINGIDYTGAKTYNIEKSLDTLCGGFNMTFADDGSTFLRPAEIVEGDEIQLYFDNVLYMTNIVDKVEQTDTGFSLDSREKTSILVDTDVEISELIDVSFNSFIVHPALPTWVSPMGTI